VIGGAIALELARAGLRVGVFDRQQPGQEASGPARDLSPRAGESWNGCDGASGKSEPRALSRICCAGRRNFREENRFSTEGNAEALFSGDTKKRNSAPLSRLHHGLGLKAEPLRAEDARELEPALSEEVEAPYSGRSEASWTTAR